MNVGAVSAETPEPGEGRMAFRVAGTVQGIGYRWWIQRTALALGLRGSVRNLRDGSVEVHVAGTALAVAALERRLADGPGGARVRSVERLVSDLPIPEVGFNIEPST